MQTKNCAAKLKIENISMQIKNEKSCARSKSDENLVRAVGPFMFHVCNIFSLHVKFLICMCNPSGPPYITQGKMQTEINNN